MLGVLQCPDPCERNSCSLATTPFCPGLVSEHPKLRVPPTYPTLTQALSLGRCSRSKFSGATYLPRLGLGASKLGSAAYRSKKQGVTVSLPSTSNRILTPHCLPLNVEYIGSEKLAKSYHTGRPPHTPIAFYSCDDSQTHVPQELVSSPN